MAEKNWENSPLVLRAEEMAWAYVSAYDIAGRHIGFQNTGEVHFAALKAMDIAAASVYDR